MKSSAIPFPNSARDNYMWYEVEKITKKQFNSVTKAVEYLVKWKKWPLYQSSWKGLEDLNCPELIDAFEETEKHNETAEDPNSTKSPEQTVVKPTQSGQTQSNKKRKLIEKQPQSKRTASASNGETFTNGSVVGVTMSEDGNLVFAIKKGKFAQTEAIPALQATLDYPQAILDFYRKNLPVAYRAKQH